jgi:tRNA(fMet)-specific endonuclease VapC
MYLLDTNAAIATMSGKPASVRGALDEARVHHHATALSVLTIHELWYGVAKSERKAANTEALQRLMASGFEIWVFDEDDAEIAGEIRGELAKAGTPIGPYDLLIAAQALRRNAVLVTANEREFTRVRGLRTKNWAKP